MASSQSSKTLYVVKAGDHISSIALAHGYRDWNTLWKQNTALASQRNNPHMLFHGDSQGKGADVLVIGGVEEKNESCSSESLHPFVVPVMGLFLRLKILDEKLQPLKNAEYELVVEGRVYKGRTDGAGLIEQAIASSARQGRLHVTLPPEWIKDVPTPLAGLAQSAEGLLRDLAGAPPPKKQPRVSFALQIGRLDPILEKAPDINCLSGIQARLNNLAFEAGRVDGKMGNATRAALKRFQKRMRLPETGQPDVATQARLRELHDTPAPGPLPQNPGGAPAPVVHNEQKAPAAAMANSNPANGLGTTSSTADDGAATNKKIQEFIDCANKKLAKTEYYFKLPVDSHELNGFRTGVQQATCALKGVKTTPTCRSMHVIKKAKDILLFQRKDGKSNYIPGTPPQGVTDAMNEAFKEVNGIYNRYGKTVVDPSDAYHLQTSNTPPDFDNPEVQACLLSYKQRRENNEGVRNSSVENEVKNHLKLSNAAKCSVAATGDKADDIKAPIPSEANLCAGATDVGYVAPDPPGGQVFNTLVIRPAYRVRIRMDDLDLLFPETVDDDAGRMARLQALEYFSLPLGHAKAGDCLKKSWKYFCEHAEPNATLSEQGAKQKLRTLLRNGVLEGGQLPKPGNFAKLFLTGAFIWSAAWHPERFTSSDRRGAEKDLYDANKALGAIPILAKVEKRYPSTEWMPAENASVYFQLVQPANLAAGQIPPALRDKPKAFVKRIKDGDPPAANDPQVDNAHQAKGGKRSLPVAGNLFETGVKRQGFHTAPEGGRPLGHDDLNAAGDAGSICHAVRAVANDKGEAGAIFTPCHIGGSRYKIRVFVGAGTLDSDGKEIESLQNPAINASQGWLLSDGRASHIVETGTMVIWRMVRFSQVLAPPLAAGVVLDPYVFDDNTTGEYARAFIQPLVDSNTSRTISRGEWQTAYEKGRNFVMGTYANKFYTDVLLPANLEANQSSWVPILSAARYNQECRRVGKTDADKLMEQTMPDGSTVATPTDGQLTTIKYGIISKILDQMMAHFTDDGYMPGVTVIRAPDCDSAGYYGLLGKGNNQHGCYVFCNAAVQGNVKAPDPLAGTAVHELGHILLLRHQFTNSNESDSDRAFISTLHDEAVKASNPCIMSYHNDCDGSFCGKTLMHLQGWDIKAVGFEPAAAPPAAAPPAAPGAAGTAAAHEKLA